MFVIQMSFNGSTILVGPFSTVEDADEWMEEGAKEDRLWPSSYDKIKLFDPEGKSWTTLQPR